MPDETEFSPRCNSDAERVASAAARSQRLGVTISLTLQSLARGYYRFAPESGIYENLVPLGENVAAGQPVGAIHFVEWPDREPVPVVALSGVPLATRAPSLAAHAQQGPRHSYQLHLFLLPRSPGREPPLGSLPRPKSLPGNRLRRCHPPQPPAHTAVPPR